MSSLEQRSLVNTSLGEAYNNGKRDYRRMKGILECPYARGTQQWTWWREGWLDACIGVNLEGLRHG